MLQCGKSRYPPGPCPRLTRIKDEGTGLSAPTENCFCQGILRIWQVVEKIRPPYAPLNLQVVHHL